jgi:hypothetical protein
VGAGRSGRHRSFRDSERRAKSSSELWKKQRTIQNDIDEIKKDIKDQAQEISYLPEFVAGVIGNVQDNLAAGPKDLGRRVAKLEKDQKQLRR